MVSYATLIDDRYSKLDVYVTWKIEFIVYNNIVVNLMCMRMYLQCCFKFFFICFWFPSEASIKFLVVHAHELFNSITCFHDL